MLSAAILLVSLVVYLVHDEYDFRKRHNRIGERVERKSDDD